MGLHAPRPWHRRARARARRRHAPGAEPAGDPRREVTVYFDDRRRLEDRIYRLSTGKAWSQVPPSRTVRLVTNVEAFRTEERTVLMVRSNLLLAEFRAGETRTLAA